MGGACSTYYDEEMCIRVLWRNVKERAHLEDLGIDTRVILKCSFEKWDGEGMNWNGLAQDSDR
jgi:hypothetical protein